MDPKQLIQDLLAYGMTQAEIGKVISLSQPSVSDILRGRTKTVIYEVGKALLDLHAAKCQHKEAA